MTNVSKLILMLAMLLACAQIATAQERQESRDDHKAFENVQTEWLEYEPAVVTLEGRLSMKTFFGPPNFGEDPKTDSKEETRILVLDTPINVRAKDETDPVVGPSAENVREVQLVFNGPLRKLVGKKLIVRGTLYHAHTGHHFTDVLLRVESIRVAR